MESSPEIADIELGDIGLHCCPLLSSAIPFIHSSKFKMASRRKSVPVLNYNELNNLSSEIIFKTGRKPKGKFFSVERIISRRKVAHVS